MANKNIEPNLKLIGAYTRLDGSEKFCIKLRPDMLWAIVIKDLPVLKEEISVILES